MSTGIQWTNETWNPVTGCTKVSPGCRNCYAETIANRWWGTRKFTDVRCHEDRLSKPMSWKSPKRIFVNSMSDLFHESVPDSFIEKVCETIGNCPQHTFQILTKRDARLREWNFSAYSNAWIGVSVESPRYLSRLDSLRSTPAIVRWVSFEPLITRLGKLNLDGIHWVVIGGESGLLKDVRPFNIDWAREIIRDCQAAGVPVFMKQIGSHAVKTDIRARMKTIHPKGGSPNEWPEDLRVREYPT